MLDYLHNAVMFCLFLMALWALVSPCVPTGVLGTAGAAGVAIAALGSLDYWMSPTTLVNWFAGSCSLICLQVGWCVRSNRRKAR